VILILVRKLEAELVVVQPPRMEVLLVVDRQLIPVIAWLMAAGVRGAHGVLALVVQKQEQEPALVLLLKMVEQLVPVLPVKQARMVAQ